jgi:hypothetical protein
VTASASRRDSLLGLAAGGLAAGFLLYTIARLLELTDSFVRPYPTELQAAAGLHVLSAAAAAAAFALAATALLRDPERRAERLSMATAALATSFLAGAVGHATTTVFLSTQRFTQRGAEEAFAVQAAGAFALAVAAVVAAAAFRAQPRDRLLGWSCAGLAVGFAVLTVGAILTARMYSDLATSHYVAGLGAVAAGNAIAVAATLVAAVAFLGSPDRATRDIRLGGACAVAFGAFLVAAAGYLLVAWLAPSNGADGRLVAADWLVATGTVGFAGAFLYAAAGLWPPTLRR